MDLKLTYKYIDVNPFSKTILFEKIFEIVCINMFFSFLITRCLFLMKKNVIYVYIFSNSKGFLKGVFAYICEIKRNIVM